MSIKTQTAHWCSLYMNEELLFSCLSKWYNNTQLGGIDGTPFCNNSQCLIEAIHCISPTQTAILCLCVVWQRVHGWSTWWIGDAIYQWQTRLWAVCGGSKQHLFIPCVSIHTWGMTTSNSVHKLADTAPTYKQWGFRCRIVSQLTKRIIVAVCVCALWENAGCICSGMNGHWIFKIYYDMSCCID